MLFNVDMGVLTVWREEGDPKFYGRQNAAGESALLYHVKRTLNRAGLHLVKVRMWKDGHLVDELQQYLRTGTAHLRAGFVPAVYILNSQWPVEGAEQSWNAEGRMELMILFDVLERGEGAQAAHREAFVALLKEHGLWAER